MQWNSTLGQWIWDNGTDWDPSPAEIEEANIRDAYYQKTHDRAVKQIDGGIQQRW